MKRLNVAIIGQGRSGRDIHGRYLKTDNDRFKVAAVVELLEERRGRAEEEYGCPSYADYRELFGRRDIDLVVNAAYSHMHTPVTIDLLEHGFNVLCDKPFARTVKDVDAMNEAAKRSGKLLAPFQQSRYGPYFRQVKKVIDSGVLGRIIQISIAFNGFSRRWDWQTLQEYNGGNLMNTGPHPLDQALALLDYDGMPAVTCVMDHVNTFGDAEDYVKLILQAPLRPVMDIEISSCCAYSGFVYNVQGKYGGLTGTMDHIEWKYFKPSEAPDQHLVATPLANTDGTPRYCSEELKWYSDSWVLGEGIETFTAMAASYYDMLYNTLAFGAPLEITVQQVRRQIAVIEECVRQNPGCSRKNAESST